jgi:hypothetical protein
LLLNKIQKLKRALHLFKFKRRFSSNDELKYF